MKDKIWSALPSYSGYKLQRLGVDIFHTDYNLPAEMQLQFSVIAERILNDLEENTMKITLPRKEQGE